MSVSELNERLLIAAFDAIQLEDGWLWINEGFIPPPAATRYLNQLREETAWVQPTIKLGAKLVNSPRLSAWHGDPDSVYTYSGLRNKPLPWTETLLQLRNALECLTEIRFNSVLLNLYRNGSDSMGWHADNEPELGDQPIIVSISLGEQRKFMMKHKKLACRWERHLKHGSALVMAGDTQRYWRHCVPKTKSCNAERINLTFRQIVKTEGQL
ncbi:MAG: alpha-ketoglutarate-dependent dioxygenase AlkB [Acidiferrobacterales bacterium]|nr:alpha-ketoglutarate-dependent dioxygenase AlkB [Acidiferrobacterales bacterium]